MLPRERVPSCSSNAFILGFPERGESALIRYRGESVVSLPDLDRYEREFESDKNSSYH